MIGEQKTDTPQLPDRGAFIQFWERDPHNWGMLLFYVVYLGVMALYAVVARLINDWVCRIDTAGHFSLPFSLLSLIVGVAYIILVPYLCERTYRKRYAKFIQCPQCGEWLGRVSYGVPNPKWEAIIQTGCCGNCGEQILASN